LKNLAEIQYEVGMLKKQVNELQKKSTLEDIILNGQYVVLAWQGEANGANLTQMFLNSIIVDKKLLIKSFRIIPYALVESDVFFNRTSVEHFTVPVDARLINVIDLFTDAARINVNINGGGAPIFPTISNAAFPLDLFVDNIYYHCKTPITKIEVQITGQILINLDVATPDAPNVKVIMECYLF